MVSCRSWVSSIVQRLLEPFTLLQTAQTVEQKNKARRMLIPLVINVSGLIAISCLMLQQLEVLDLVFSHGLAAIGSGLLVLAAVDFSRRL